MKNTSKKRRDIRKNTTTVTELINKFLEIHDERRFIVNTLTKKIENDWSNICRIIFESHNNKSEANIKFSILNELHDITNRAQFTDKIKRICFNEYIQQQNKETSDSDSDD